MGEALEVGNNREGGHTKRNCNTNWKRIGKNILGKVVFDAVGVMLEGKNEAWETDAGEV